MWFCFFLKRISDPEKVSQKIRYIKEVKKFLEFKNPSYSIHGGFKREIERGRRGVQMWGGREGGIKELIAVAALSCLESPGYSSTSTTFVLEAKQATL